MSLECEGDGAPCTECGEFDFLPQICPWCRGTFCAAHATCHHIPAPAASTAAAAGAARVVPLSEEVGPIEASHLTLLCTPPQATSTPTKADATFALSAPAGGPQHRCVVCQSVLCALAPCPECGDCYCAAHRFHVHEGTAAKHRQQESNHRAVSFRHPGHSAAETVDLTAVLCAPFTSAHPLVLAPVGYRSRRTDLLAIIVAPATDAATAFTKTVAGPSDASAYTVGVCSLVVATEMSAGQLCDRLVEFLRDVPAPVLEQVGDSQRVELLVSPGWSEWVSSAHASLFSVAPAVITTGSVPTAGSVSHRAPTLSLVQLPLHAIIREAPIVNATVVLSLANATTTGSTLPDDRVALQHFLTTFLYGTGASSSTSSSLITALSTSTRASAHRDGRVKALATRLYLQHQQLLRRAEADTRGSSARTAAMAPDSAAVSSTQPPGDRTGHFAQEMQALAQPAPTAGSDATLSPPPASAATGSLDFAQVSAVWPFRQAPPLNRFDFFNSKMCPCGAAAIRPAGAPRVVVAVFVADAFLPVAVMPMCVALGCDWPYARVATRVREEVAEQQLSQHRDARAALNTFSVYHLGSSNCALSSTADTSGELVCLWSDHLRSPTPSAPVVLQSADVLLLCPADSPGCEAALQEELQRLRGLTGRAKTALKVDQMKKCIVM
ncbi:hypothetical protein JKF63_04562 [Porcisia hertigi]|uniref:Uncharacterized protein n=1 Tax=Porcisia hertigi TaxID=2761500 RepID=A0A836I4I8_9TRYP|nr:hypothetical protein JKF63_04562 [Porcisia hertigi]